MEGFAIGFDVIHCSALQGMASLCLYFLAPREPNLTSLEPHFGAGGGLWFASPSVPWLLAERERDSGPFHTRHFITVSNEPVTLSALFWVPFT